MSTTKEAVRRLDLDCVFKTFDGKEIPFIAEGDARAPMTLRLALLSYCRATGQMPYLIDTERLVMYKIGLLVGGERGSAVNLTQAEYDVLKKVADNGTVTLPQNDSVQPIFGPEVRWRVKELIDTADIIN